MAQASGLQIWSREVTCDTRARQAVRTHRRHRDRNDDDAPLGRTHAIARDGHAEAAADADLWFVTREGMAKLADIEHDPHINLAYYKDRTKEWVSVSGVASISRDRQKIHELYAPIGRSIFPRRAIPVTDQGRSADGAHRRGRACGRLPRGQQASACRPVRAGEGLGDGRDAGRGRDSPRPQVNRYRLRGRFGTNARKRRGLSTVIRRRTSSPAPTAFNLGRKAVSVLP